MRYQTTTNACATVALLNIVMNVPGLDLGDKLQTFKEATRKLKPPYRGKRLGEHDFIRGVHNSFARYVISSSCYESEHLLMAVPARLIS